MKHEVLCYNASGKCVHEDRFSTAEQAYTAFCEIVDNLNRHLPKGYETTVVRYNDSYIVNMKTIVGKQ